MRVVFIVATALAVWWSPCVGQPEGSVNSDQERPMLNTNHVEASARLLDFSMRLATKMLTEKDERSLVFSPLSIGGALQMLVLGSRGSTFEELTQLLGYQPWTASAAIHNEFEQLIGRLLASNSNLGGPEVDHYVKVANAVFLQRGFTLRPDYKTVAQSVYRADTYTVDFRSPETVQQINQWVTESTNGKIPQIVSNPLNSQARMLIASTVYYNAKWQTTFYERQTRPRPFYVQGRNNPPVDVEMMALGGKFPFYESPEFDCQILALPYKNHTSTLFVILPNNSSAAAVRDLQRRLNANIINNQMISRMQMATSIVFLPKMHLTSTIDLHHELHGLGIRSLFDPVSADLGLISGDEQPQTFEQAGVSSGTAAFGGSHVPPHLPPFPGHQERLEDVLVFSRFGEETAEPHDMEMKQRKRRSTYKATSVNGKSHETIGMKDFLLRKRITKENKISKKAKQSSVRHKRHIVGNTLHAFHSLDLLRNQTIRNPGLFANEIVHKVDLVINEKGTEGGAATTVFLHRTGTKVTFRAEEPFLFLIRHEETQLPLFYGAVFDPRS